jgi:hypothetical protein
MTNLVRNNSGDLSIGLKTVEQTREEYNLAAAGMDVCTAILILGDDDDLPVEVVEMPGVPCAAVLRVPSPSCP